MHERVARDPGRIGVLAFSVTRMVPKNPPSAVGRAGHRRLEYASQPSMQLSENCWARNLLRALRGTSLVTCACSWTKAFSTKLDIATAPWVSPRVVRGTPALRQYKCALVAANRGTGTRIAVEFGSSGFLVRRMGLSGAEGVGAGVAGETGSPRSQA